VTDGATVKDIVIKSVEVDDETAARLPIYPSDIDGYTVYQYQIGDRIETIEDTSDPIYIERPTNMEVPVVVKIRYLVDGIDIAAKEEEVDYAKYDPIDWAVVSGQFDWDDGQFDWTDSKFAPAILYKSGSVTAYEFIGNVDEETMQESKALAAETISDGITGSATVTMQLVAMNKNNSGAYIELKHQTYDAANKALVDGDVIQAQTVVNVTPSSYCVTLQVNSDTRDIYYAFDGSGKDSWYWDKTLRYKIGEEGTNILASEISDLPEAVQTEANKVKALISPSDTVIRSFSVMVGLEKFTVVDSEGNLRNGDKLNDNLIATVDSGSTSGMQYSITTYDVDGNENGDVEVYIDD
jgi:hypothetical protein